MPNFDKLSYVGCGFFALAFAVAVFSCSEKKIDNTTPGSKAPPSTDFHAAATDVGNAHKSLNDTTTTIKQAATQGAEKTPIEVKPILDPFWQKILIAAGVQEGIVKNLADTQKKLVSAEDNAKIWEKKYTTDMTAWAAKFDKEHEARVKAESNATKELRAKYIWISVACFGVLVLSLALAFSGFGGGGFSKIATSGAIAGGIGLAVSVALIQTVQLIPWIVGGLALLGGALLVYEYFNRNKKIVKVTEEKEHEVSEKMQLQKVTEELVHTAEAAKPFMTMQGRKTVYGNGPKARAKLVNKAPSLPVPVAADEGPIHEDVLSPIAEDTIA
jgi:hypothetical protein